MFRIIRIPPALDKVFRTLHPHVHWDHGTYFGLLVMVTAFAWGRRNGATRYRYLEAPYHRTRFNNFFLVERWDAAAALRQKARERLRALRPQPGETVYLVLDDAKKAKRGQGMDAVARMKDSSLDAYIRGHQYVCAILVCRDHVIPWGIRLYRKPEHAKVLEQPFHKTTEVAAQLIREFNAPAGVNVVVLFEAY
jgi:SRSO17 transposase